MLLSVNSSFSLVNSNTFPSIFIFLSKSRYFSVNSSFSFVKKNIVLSTLNFLTSRIVQYNGQKNVCRDSNSVNKILWNKEIDKDIISSRQFCQNVCGADNFKIKKISFTKGLCCRVERNSI